MLQNEGEGRLSSPLPLCLLPPFITVVDLSDGDGAPVSLLLPGLRKAMGFCLSLPLLLWLLPLLNTLLDLGVGDGALPSSSLPQLLPAPNISL